MTNVTLKQLRYFDALARELHFGRAAEACAVTQPALSMQIHELEQSLGLVLVERTRAGVQLTGKGAEIAARCARVLGDVRDLVAYAQHSNRLLAGTLRLGVIPSVAPYLLPPLLPLLRDAYPDLELHVRETQTQPLTDELLEGKLDVLLLALPLKNPDLTNLPLFEDKFLLAMPKERKLSGRVRATKELIEHERLLLLEEGHCLRDQALTYCSLQQVDAVNTFGASSLATIVEMVSAGFGITLLPEMSIGIEERGRDITLVRFVEPEPFRTIGLVWRSTSPRTNDFEELGRLVTKAWNDGPLAAARAGGRTGTKKAATSAGS
ncbi:LysR substrate-binding domain-containing protein [Hyphomicrobium sp.]|uniref:LysR substrate-binding domain-containing protein n=1 Tax=Hyphomicrobium sp. TaxID=82 RepID=UPI002CEB9147|nr:LysR substrate-binding domain-containing protein [Hyphomicrobium sp.]HRN89943.1 LysR substrate-binding domain-containing protein [Hyphomicrobium sp.]HRQ27528.1 LysR substrate-binding domain-containing protein [Hyphomicrobium sp.]